MKKKLYSVDDVEIIKIQSIQDERGMMSIVTNDMTTFDIRRIFSIQASNCERGHHAHKFCKQFILCLTGSLKVVVKDGFCDKDFILDNPSKALYIPNGIWSYQEYQENINIINVYCDLDYDETDYIRDYKEYLLFARKSR